MSGDALDQHRRELDATYAALRAVRDAFAAVEVVTARHEGELAGVREELRALSNRVEALTRAIGADDAIASRRVVS